MENENIQQDQPINDQALEMLGSEESSSQPAVEETAVVQVEEAKEKIKWGGEEVEMPLSKVKEYAQQGYDYTQKTQELAKQREELKQMQELKGYLEQNPDKYSQIENIIQNKAQQQQVQQQAEPEYVDPEILQLRNDVATTKQQMDRMYNYLAKQDTDSALSQIEANPKYDGLFKSEKVKELLISKALADKNRPLAEVAEDMFGVFNEIKAGTKLETEKKTIEHIQNKQAGSIVAGRGSQETPKPFDPGKETWRDLEKRAVEML